MTEIAPKTWADTSFRAIVEAIPHIVWVSDLAGGVVHVNQQMTAYTGLSEAELLGTGWVAVVHPDDRTIAAAARKSGERTGEITEWLYRLRRHDGDYRYHLGRAAPVRDQAGEIVCWVATCVDGDDRRRERFLQIFFSELSRRLATSLDVAETAHTVAAACVPEAADEAAVFLREPDGPAAVHEPLLREAGGRSELLLPIRVRGHVIGVLSLAYTAASGRRYDAGNVTIGEEIAARAAIALDNAQRFEREHHVSETFQKAALPPLLPEIPGSILSATYEVGRTEAEVGGDWYDAFRLPDGRLIVSVGDVSGSGLYAAVMMGNVRQSIRTAAVINPDPAAMLDAVDRIVREIDPEKFVTAFVAVYEAIGGKIKYASAGHPPPLMRHPSGEVTRLEAGGLPLGLRRRREDTSFAMSSPAACSSSIPTG
jgi:PAS domain S-box-containing protein